MAGKQAPDPPPLKTRTEALGYILGLMPWRGLAVIFACLGLETSGCLAVKKALLAHGSDAAQLLLAAAVSFGLITVAAKWRPK